MYYESLVEITKQKPTYIHKIFFSLLKKGSKSIPPWKIIN